MFSKVIQYLFFLMLVTSAVFADVKDPAWEKYVSSQQEMQQAVYELVDLQSENTGDESKLFDLNRDLQQALIEQKNLRYYHLFSKHPERIVRDFGFASFIQFPWTESDEEELEKENRIYRKLSKIIKKNKEKLEESEGYLMLTEKFVLLLNTPEYQKIQNRFFEIPSQVEKILAQQTQHFSYHEYREIAK